MFGSSPNLLFFSVCLDTVDHCRSLSWISQGLAQTWLLRNEHHSFYRHKVGKRVGLKSMKKISLQSFINFPKSVNIEVNFTRKEVLLICSLTVSALYKVIIWLSWLASRSRNRQFASISEEISHSVARCSSRFFSDITERKSAKCFKTPSRISKMNMRDKKSEITNENVMFQFQKRDIVCYLSIILSSLF